MGRTNWEENNPKFHQTFWGKKTDSEDKTDSWDQKIQNTKPFQDLCAAAFLDYRDQPHPNDDDATKANREGTKCQEMYIAVKNIVEAYRGLKISLNSKPRPESRRDELKALAESLQTSLNHLYNLSTVAKWDLMLREYYLLNQPDEPPTDIFIKQNERRDKYEDLIFQLENMIVLINQSIQHLDQISPGSTKNPKLTIQFVIPQLKEVFDHYSHPTTRSKYYREFLTAFIQAAFACADLDCPQNLNPYL